MVWPRWHHWHALCHFGEKVAMDALKKMLAPWQSLKASADKLGTASAAADKPENTVAAANSLGTGGIIISDARTLTGNASQSTGSACAAAEHADTDVVKPYAYQTATDNACAVDDHADTNTSCATNHQAGADNPVRPCTPADHADANTPDATNHQAGADSACEAANQGRRDRGLRKMTADISELCRAMWFAFKLGLAHTGFPPFEDFADLASAVGLPWVQVATLEERFKIGQCKRQYSLSCHSTVQSQEQCSNLYSKSRPVSGITLIAGFSAT